MRSLGRLFAKDIRDTQYPLRKIASPSTTTILPSLKFWIAGPILDQGDTPQCVAYAWKQFLMTTPINYKSYPDPSLIYSMAQAVDEWASTPHDGTSVRAGAKAVQSLQYISAYHWATSMADIKNYVATSGPIVMGTDWYTKMFTPVNGYTEIGGIIEGGHAWLIIGYNDAFNAFRAVNSWGTSWGQKGRFWISYDTVSQLFADAGEACSAVKLPTHV